MIITLHGRRQLLDRTRRKLCLCVAFTCFHRSHFQDHTTGGSGHSYCVSINRHHHWGIVFSCSELVRLSANATKPNLPHDFPKTVHARNKHWPGKNLTSHSLLVLSFDFPFAFLPTFGINCIHSLHRRGHNPLQNTTGNPLRTSTTGTSSHASACVKSRRKGGSQQLKPVAQLVWRTAGWEGEPYWKVISDFSFCLFHVWNRSRQVPSMSCSLRAPPGRLVFHH